MDELCTSCLCAGRKLYFLGETSFGHIYTQILNEISIYDTSQLCVQVCWECRSTLQRFHTFKQQAQNSYITLLHHLNQNTAPPPAPPRLSSHTGAPFSYPLLVKREPDVKLESEGEGELEHCEPETFVGDLHVEQSLGKKSKEKKKKSKVKNKTKVKKKKRKKYNDVDIDASEEIYSDNSANNHGTEELEANGEEFKEEAVKQENVREEMEKNNEEKESEDLEGKCDFEANKLDSIDNDHVAVVPKPKVPRAPRSKEVLPAKPQCVECGKMFSSKKTYRYHMNVLHRGQNNHECPRCGKVYQWRSNLGRHMRTHKARDLGELHCALCDKRFASVATYRQHLRISRRHVSETDYNFVCNECGKKFVSKTRLRDHIDWEHLRRIKFKCPLCDKPFKCNTSLYVHTHNVHGGDAKGNLCHVCGKAYRNAAKLKYHIVAMHTSETPYRCAHCPAAFGWYSSLYRHVRETHYKMKVQPNKSRKMKKPPLQLDELPPVLPMALHPPANTMHL